MTIRRLKTVFLPTVIITLVIISVVTVVAASLKNNYRDNVNRETARLLGVAAASDPDLDAAEIIQTLRTPDVESEALGMEILREYGYLPSDTFASSAENFSLKLSVLLILGILSLAFLTLSYFWYRDWSEERSIGKECRSRWSPNH